MIDIIQGVTWPGVFAAESCAGTISHGVTPSVWTLVTYPQAAAPAEAGDLTLTDGRVTLRLRDCKVDGLKGRYGSDGQTWVLSILDRRWKWRGGRISGRYNQLDPRGKLVPWTVRSPEELARLCLEAMGETGYVLDLPAGLTKADGEKVERFLRPGEDFAQSLANPPVVWDNTPPAEALARLADAYGRRVVFQPFADRVAVVPLGVGLPLPEGPCELIAPSVDAPETPRAVGVAGAPVRVQMRFALEAVGEEWDGQILPINELSYAPELDPAVQVTTVTFSGSGNPDLTLTLTTYGPGGTSVGMTWSAGTVAQKLANLVTQIGGIPEFNRVLTASATATVLTLTGRRPGESFGAEASSTNITPPDTWTAACTQQPVGPGQKNWNACRPPNFAAVRETERLSYSEAVGLARKSVFRYYRIRFVDPGTRRNPIRVPWYRGDVVRRHQFVLQPTKVEEVEPAPRDTRGRDKDLAPGDPRRDPYAAAVFGGVLPDYYGGYARDKAATVTGSVSARIGSVFWNGTDLNTLGSDRVRVGFAVDPAEQMVAFSEYVYRLTPAGGLTSFVEPPELTLETAVLLTDAETGEPVRWEERLELGGAGPVEWAVRDDVAVGVIGEYDENANHLRGHRLADERDARERARYYLEGMARRYQLTGGETRQYIGVWAIDPDGYTQQVSWSVGPGGATTVASSNSEHSDVIPPYPARRRAENLAANAQAAQANLTERAAVDAKAAATNALLIGASFLRRTT